MIKISSGQVLVSLKRRFMDKTLSKNLSYTIFSNFAALMVSVAITLLVPRLVPVDTYGYWQLYLLFASYIGFAHFGWLDGIYLKYGGARYEELDKGLLKSQAILLIFLQCAVALLICIYAYFFVDDAYRQIIFFGISLTLIIANLQTYCSYILQVTNRFDDNAKMNISYLVVYGIGLTVIVISPYKELGFMISADIFGRFCALLLGINFIKDIFKEHASIQKQDIMEALDSIKIGINLLIANLTGSLIVGSVSFSVEAFWSIETFARISLALSLSNFVMVFMNAVGMVMFPLIRRTPRENIAALYMQLRKFLLLFLSVILITYFPVTAILGAWLPKYQLSLHMFALIFPMILFEGRRSLLATPYMNALRLEKLTRSANIITFIISLILALVFGAVVHQIEYMAISLVACLALRSFLLEYYLSITMGIRPVKYMIFEVFIAISFALLAYNLPLLEGFIAYAVIALIIVFLNRKSIYTALSLLLSKA